MFKGLQDIIGKKPTSTPAPPKGLMHVHTAEKLLADPERQHALQKFTQSLGLSQENHQQLATPLLERFAEFVQLLPETRNSYFAHNGGMLDHGLSRAVAALELLRDYFLPDSEDISQLTQPQLLWSYTLFSAALLNGVGKVVTDLIVELYDKRGEFVKVWSPFEGAMPSQGARFDYEFEKPQASTFRRRVTILIARQLMPEVGFNWIASDKEVLAVWLALLEDDTQAAGTLGPILWQVEAEIIHESLNTPNFDFDGKLDKDSKPKGSISTFISPQTFDADRDVKPGEATVAGREFLRWVTKGLVSERLMLNEPPLFMVPGGLLISREMFSLFAKESLGKSATSAQTSALANKIEKQVINLGLHEGTAVQGYKSIKDGSRQIGLVIKNAAVVLPATFKVLTDSRDNAQTFTPDKLIRSPELANTLQSLEKNTVKDKQFIAPDGKLVTKPEAQQRVNTMSTSN